MRDPGAIKSGSDGSQVSSTKSDKVPQTTAGQPGDFSAVVWSGADGDLGRKAWAYGLDNAHVTWTTSDHGELLKMQQELVNTGAVLGVHHVTAAKILSAASVECPDAFACTMEWIVDNVVKPLTAERQCPLLHLLLGAKAPCSYNGDRVPVVALATDFHSYTWKENLYQTRDAFEGAFDEYSNNDAARYVWYGSHVHM